MATTDGFQKPVKIPVGEVHSFDFASAFGVFGTSICDDIKSFGSKRMKSKVGQHFTLGEKAKIALDYQECASGLYRKRRGTVSRLAWLWGCTSKSIRAVYCHVKYGDDLDEQVDRSKEGVLDQPKNHAALIAIVVHRRGRVNKRKLARMFEDKTGIKVHCSTIYRHLKKHDLEVKRRRYVPKLREHHKSWRYMYGNNHLRQSWEHWVDLDEKWFYVVRIKGWVWILPGYMDPDDIKAIRVESKRYIQKVMYLCAVAKPVLRPDGSVLFSGKVGCWRVAEIKTYASDYNGKFKSHKAGDKYVVDKNMDGEMYLRMMEEKLLPVLKRLKSQIWDPLAKGKAYRIGVQHDGAPGHRAQDIERRLNTFFEKIGATFIRQPAKSPCTNMLDMAVFNSMASYVAQTDYDNKRDLDAAVREAWDALKPSTLLMQWACKSVTMAQLVHHRGDEFRPAHPGLRKAFKSGGWAGVDAKVARICAFIDPIYPK